MNVRNRKRIIILVPVLILLLIGIYLFRCWYFDFSGRGQHRATLEALRQIHIALENFYVNRYRYPSATEEEGANNTAEEGYTYGIAPWRLLPRDELPRPVLRKAQRTSYASDYKNMWIISHPGPDGELGVDLKAWIRDATGDLELYTQNCPEGLIEYDPSNGVVSPGDIWRTGP